MTEADTGVPVSGARVWIVVEGSPLTSAAIPAATSGAEGRFRIHGALPRAANESPWIGAYALGFRPWCERAAPGGAEQAVRLARGASIAGRVVDSEGAGVSDATVTATGRFGDDVARSAKDESEMVFGPRSVPRIGRSRTDAEGRFRIEGLEDGERYLLQASASGYCPALGDAPLEAIGGRDAPAMLHLLRRYVVDAVAVDARTGARIPFASITGRGPSDGVLGPSSPDPSEEIWPSSGGFPGFPSGGESRFWFARVTGGNPGPFWLSARAPGYQDLTVETAPADFPGTCETLRMNAVAGESARVAFRAALGGSSTWTGNLKVTAQRREGGAYGFVLGFERGACPAVVPLPPGTWTFVADGATRATLWWRTAAVLRDVALRADEERTLTLPLAGGRLAVFPQTETDPHVREFTLQVTGGGAGYGSIDTSTLPTSSRMADGDRRGYDFWFPAGTLRVSAWKLGFAFPGPRVDVEIPAGGDRVEWAPTLVRSERLGPWSR